MMQSIPRKRSERIGLVLDDGKREKIETEARRRSTSMSSVIREIVISQFAAKQSDSQRATA